jgi:uncharacterized protein (DUF1800 family)
LDIPIGRIMNAQVALGAPLWRPPAPNGYSDNEAAWVDGILRRIDIATEFCRTRVALRAAGTS